MCIISGPVSSVKRTKLFAIPSKNGKRQLTVYTNEVETPAENLMCLAVPNPESVKFETVSKDIFDQCWDSFAHRPVHEKFCAAEYGTRGLSAALPVFSHGSYDVVIVPSVTELHRVPEGFAIFTPEVVAFLKHSYPVAGFGLLLCKLKAGSVEYEPFAYSHDILPNGNLFFPTKHYHVEEEDSPKARWRKLLDIVNAPEDHQTASDWDHKIYSAMTPLICHTSKTMGIRPINAIDWSKMSADFRYNHAFPLRCLEIVGEASNADIEIPFVIV